MDMVMRCDRVPMAGQSVLAANYDYTYVPGGKGANSAVAAARLDCDVLFCGRVGPDANGEQLRRTLGSCGVDTRFLGTDRNSQTGLAAIMVERSGQNRIIVYPGANRKISRGDVEDAFLAYPDALLMQFETSDEAVLDACYRAERQNIPVVIDAGPSRPDFPFRKLGRVEIFSPNETECYDITNVKPTDMDACLKACLALQTRVDAKFYILKLGDRGSFAYDGKFCEYFPSYDVPEVVDTTAAGDAFTAALTAEYLRSGSIKRACRFANAVGALTVTKAGAIPSLPKLSEVEAFVDENSIKL